MNKLLKNLDKNSRTLIPQSHWARMSTNQTELVGMQIRLDSGSFGVAISNAIRIHFECTTNSLRMTTNIRFLPKWRHWYKYSLQGAALVCSGFVLYEMDLYDKAIVLQLFAFFEELIKKESEKTVKPRQANKKVKQQRKPNNSGIARRGAEGAARPGCHHFGVTPHYEATEKGWHPWNPAPGATIPSNATA